MIQSWEPKGNTREKPSEECGVAGVFAGGRTDCARSVYYALYALQHRGQESCGIAVSDMGVVNYCKDMGLVSEVFDEKTLDRLTGQIAVGHVRYSTTGSSVRENAQPLVSRYIKGTLSIAHNGNLTNAYAIKKELEQKGAIFQTTIDSEALAYLIARERACCHSVEDAVKRALPKVQGSYCLLVMSPRKLIAARDPYGVRPLCLGRLEDGYAVASETCALDAMGAEFVRDILPGEIVTVDGGGVRSDFFAQPVRPQHCIFEYIYFARPDSVLDGVHVYDARIRAGRILARTHPVEADLVIGVPESGTDAAMGYAMESGIPYGKGFIKNNYVGRTFIKPRQSQREAGVRLKLNVLKSCVQGRRVVMVDDSIVRGTTCAKIVRMLREAGAKEVHVRISAPEFRYPCYYGTDIPTEENLISHGRTAGEVSKIIGADSLGFLPVTALGEMIGAQEKSYCDACFTGEYEMPVPEPGGYEQEHNCKC